VEEFRAELERARYKGITNHDAVWRNRPQEAHLLQAPGADGGASGQRMERVEDRQVGRSDPGGVAW
jgi:hypothetical protein